MRKSKSEVDDDFSEVHFLAGADDDDDIDNVYLRPQGAAPANEQRLPARQRLELRNEQRSLREQLSDWDDYENDFDTNL